MIQNQARSRPSVHQPMPLHQDDGTAPPPPLHPCLVPPLLWCLPKAIFRTNPPSAMAHNFRFDAISSTPLSASLAMASTNQRHLSRAAAQLHFYFTVVDIGREQSYPLFPLYPNILHPPIKIFLDLPVPLPPLRDIYRRRLSNWHWSP